MVNRKLFILVIMLVLFSTSVVASNCVYYFYADDCPSCQKTTKLIDSLEKKYEHLNVERYDVYKDLNNAKLLESYFSRYSVKEEGIPAIFVKGSYMISEHTISSLLEGLVSEDKDLDCPTLSDSAVIGLTSEGESHNVLKTINVLSLTGSGIRDSFRLNMVALMLIFILILGFKKDLTKLTHRGVLFISMIFAFNILFSLGMFSDFAASSLPKLFYKAVGIFASAYGIAHIYAFVSDNKFFEKLSKKGKERIMTRLNFLISPIGVLIISIIAGIFSITNRTSQFMLLRNVAAQNGSMFVALPMIIYYCLVLVVPFVLLLYGFYRVKKDLASKANKKGRNLEQKIDSWNKHNHKVLNFVVACVIAFVGLILTFV